VRTLLRAILLASFTLALSAPNAAAQNAASQNNDVFEQSSAELSMTPSTIKPVKGKYPDSIPFLITLKNCNTTASPKAAFQDVAGLKTTDFDIEVLSAGITIANGANIMDCQITGQLKIESTQVSTGYAIMTVTRKVNGTNPARYMGRAVFTVLDTGAAPVPGEASVDGSFTVMGDEMCKKNFGRQVAKSTYCIEVKIGNNSGYPLQLAGIGFRRQRGNYDADINVNLSYRSVRASLQDDSNFGRATLISALEATGLLMAGADPFFHAAYSKTRFTAFTALMGTILPNGASQIWPNTDQQKMNNLDDQAFRDTLLIANNTPVRTTVFIDRTVMDGIGQQYAKDICEGKIPGKTQPSDGSDKFGFCPTFDSRHRITDPNLVKMALGNLVIVGNLMNYMQRIVVDPAALAAAQAASKNGALSDPSIASGNKILTLTVPSGMVAPPKVFLSLSDLNKLIEYDLSPSTQTSGTVTYSAKDTSSTGLPSTGTYVIVDSNKQLVTNPGVTLQVVGAPADAPAPAPDGKPVGPAPAATSGKPAAPAKP
jgi:hypothetical protein